MQVISRCGVSNPALLTWDIKSTGWGTRDIFSEVHYLANKDEIMSGLKIDDLSFCEIEVYNDLKVQGGLFPNQLFKGISNIFGDDLAEFDKHPGEYSLEKETTDKFGIKHKISAKKTENSKVITSTSNNTKGGAEYFGSILSVM